MSSPEEPLTLWRSLANAADRGDLFLNSEAAAACNKACEDYIAKLVRRLDDASDLADCNGWGDFDSGQTLRKIFAEKAVGGPNSMASVLQSHIEVVMEMQAVFRKFFADTDATDDSNAADLGNQGPK